MTVRSPSHMHWADLFRTWRAEAQRPGSVTTLSSGHLVTLVVSLWLVLGVAISVRTLLRPDSHTVFPIFAASSGHWWSDQSLYDRYPPLDHFRYPPLFAVLVTPFAALGLRAGGVLWSWVSLAIYAAGLWRFAREVVPAPW